MTDIVHKDIKVIPQPQKLDYSRVDKFMSLFTPEEKESWDGRESKAPDWVLSAILWFMGQDPGHQELMRRLKDS